MPVVSLSLRRRFLRRAGEPDVQAQSAFFGDHLAFDFGKPSRGGATVLRLQLQHDLRAEDVEKVRWVEGLSGHDRGLVEAHQTRYVTDVPVRLPFEVRLEEKADVSLARQRPGRLARHFMMSPERTAFRLNAGEIAR